MALLDVPRDTETLLNEQPFVFVYRIYEADAATQIQTWEVTSSLGSRVTATSCPRQEEAMVSLHFLRKLKTLSPCRCVCWINILLFMFDNKNENSSSDRSVNIPGLDARLCCQTSTCLKQQKWIWIEIEEEEEEEEEYI